MLDRYPRLMLDISWRVIDDAYFSDAARRAVYVPFLNEYSERILPGTDFLASREKDIEVYRTELRVTSRILGHLDDAAFRNIALGENYFRLLGLDYTAPPGLRRGGAARPRPLVEATSVPTDGGRARRGRRGGSLRPADLAGGDAASGPQGGGACAGPDRKPGRRERPGTNLRHPPGLMAAPAEAGNALFASSEAASSIPRTAAVAGFRPRLWR